jgi:hypothetical protein
MPRYILRVFQNDSSVVPLHMPSGTKPLDAINAANHYVNTEQAAYVEVLSVGFTGVARLLGTAGSKPTT